MDDHLIDDPQGRVQVGGIYATPQPPAELLALSGVFAIIQLAIIWLLTKVAFMRGWEAGPRSVSSSAARL